MSSRGCTMILAPVSSSICFMFVPFLPRMRPASLSNTHSRRMSSELTAAALAPPFLAGTSWRSPRGRSRSRPPRPPRPPRSRPPSRPARSLSAPPPSRPLRSRERPLRPHRGEPPPPPPPRLSRERGRPRSPSRSRPILLLIYVLIYLYVILSISVEQETSTVILIPKVVNWKVSMSFNAVVLIKSSCPG